MKTPPDLLAGRYTSGGGGGGGASTAAAASAAGVAAAAGRAAGPRDDGWARQAKNAHNPTVSARARSWSTRRMPAGCTGLDVVAVTVA